MRKRQWKEVENDEWDIVWIDKEWVPEVMDHQHVSQFQRVNHYRNHFELTRKDLMIKNFKKHKKQLEKDGKSEEAQQYNYVPVTYNVPSEYAIFYEEFTKVNQMQDSKQIWIMKPTSRAQGKGIFLFKNIKDITNWKNTYRYSPDNPKVEPYVVQKYISEPLLIGGKKFDLRIFALCTCYQPLTVYLYRTGFARFTHNRYDNDDITNTYVHITNVAIQKTSENYDDKLGGKWLLQTLKLYLIAKYGQEKVSECFYQIQNIIIKSLQTVQKVILNDKRCFELYGFDILLDANLKPWVLEINASPSMTSNTQQDYDLKVGLLDDVFTVIDQEKILTGQEEQLGGFDLIFKGQPIKLPTNSTYSSLLGCYNNRTQQLKKLAKSTAIRLAQIYTEKYNQQTKQRSISKGTGAQSNGTQQQQQQLQISMANQQQQQQIPKAPINKYNSAIQRSAYPKQTFQEKQIQNRNNQQQQQQQQQIQPPSQQSNQQKPQSQYQQQQQRKTNVNTQQNNQQPRQQQQQQQQQQNSKNNLQKNQQQQQQQDDDASSDNSRVQSKISNNSTTDNNINQNFERYKQEENQYQSRSQQQQYARREEEEEEEEEEE